ncbi:MAG TPA: DUF1559 domain-containing protein [Chthonomonadaceae bacterium]|nr:DUF1559 domain-containing protein [Chthonomonadaceae bacterium]
MKQKGFTLVELLIVCVVIAVLAALLFPVLVQAREATRSAACLSNLKQIGLAIRMYAQDYDGEYPNGCYNGIDNSPGRAGGMPAGSRNWEVSPDWREVDRGPDNDFGCYGARFYRFLMHKQLASYTQSATIWYCPSDKYRRATPDNIAAGLQSYHWFPNWHFNIFCPGSSYGYPGPYPCLGPNLANDPPRESAQYFTERMLLTERGVYGFDGPDSPLPERHAVYNHACGYSILFFDGHVKQMPYGHKAQTLPATNWPSSG